MNPLKRFRQPKRLPNITAYCLSAVVNGEAKSSPLGVVPRLSDECEDKIRMKQKPVGTAYINDTINGVSVILCWTGERVEAISFLSVDDAQAFPGFRPFDTDDLVKLNAALTHFPR